MRLRLWLARALYRLAVRLDVTIRVAPPLVPLPAGPPKPAHRFTVRVDGQVRFTTPEPAKARDAYFAFHDPQRYTDVELWDGADRRSHWQRGW